MTTLHQREEHSGPVALLRILRRRIGVLIACAILVPAAALAFSLVQEKEYTASSKLLFRDPQFDQTLFGAQVFARTVDPSREAATNVRLVSLDVVADRTARALGGAATGPQIKGKIVVSPEGESDVVSIQATDPTPTVAARMANEFAKQYIAFRREADRSKITAAQQLVQSQLDRLSPEQREGGQGRNLRQRAEELEILASLQTGNAELVQTADVPSAASSPKPVRNTALGLVLGILLGLGLAILLERLDRRLKDPKEISDAFDRPILGAIPQSRTIAAAGDPQRLAPGEAEAFRMLRANLRYFNVDRKIDSVLITSSSPGDGKSTVAMHLASAAAGAGMRVLLIEADLRHPTLARRLGLPGNRGLSQLLAGEFPSVADAAYTLPAVGRSEGKAASRTFDVLVSGPIPPNPTDLIESDRMRQVIRNAERDYDLVVVDTPPTSVVSDAIPLVKEVSGVIVVCRLAKTTRESAHHLRDQLFNLEANLLGVVINSVGRQTGYGYGYGYGYGPQEQKRRRSGREAVRTPSAATNGHAATERRDSGNGGPRVEAPPRGLPEADSQPEGEPAAVGAPAAPARRARRGGLLGKLRDGS